MIVVEELSAELEIELASYFGDPVADILCLKSYVFVVVKSEFLHIHRH